MSHTDHEQLKRLGSFAQMSHTDHEQLKRLGSLAQSPTDAKKLKESENVKREKESSEDKLSAEELKMLQPFQGTYLTLLVGGRKLIVRKEDLVSASPVFETMVNSNFKEASQSEIPLPGKKAGHFVRFLRYILPGFTDELKEDTVHDVLQLAEEYQVDTLKERIDIFLAKCVTAKGDEIRSQEIVRNLLEAELYKLSKYLDQCKHVAAKKLSQNLKTCQGYQDISKDTRLEIYTMRCSIIDAILNNGRLYRPDQYLTSKTYCIPVSLDCLHVGMKKDDGEKLRTFLQDN